MIMKFFLLVLISIVTILSASKKEYDTVISFKQVVFKYNVLSQESKTELDQIADEIKKYQNVSKKIKVEIAIAENDVDEDNADNVKDILILKGIPKKRIKIAYRAIKGDLFGNDNYNKIVNIKLFAFEGKDSDSDGIYDNNDKCPDTKIGTEVGSDGCGLKSLNILVDDTGEQVILHFDSNNKLSIESKKVLEDILVQKLNKN